MKPFTGVAKRFVQLIAGFSLAITATCATFANPILDNISAGQVSIQDNANTTTINQTSQQAIINWKSFNIGNGESTHFNQPLGGIALNRINPSQGASQIYGSLTSTGQIILMNPAGFYFGSSAYVNVGSMIAATGNMTDQQFLNGMYQFSKVNGYSGAIINEGQIIAAQNGLIALLAPGVINNGVIEANLGKIALASGDSFTVNFANDNMISFAVDVAASQPGTDKDGKALSAGINNSGSLIANGGKIMLSAKSAAGVLDHVINLQGVLQAKSVYQDKGAIIISSDPNAGSVNISAKIDASGKSAGEKGGDVTITGHNILLDSAAMVDVSGDIGGGNINIGGSYQGVGPLANANAVVMMPNAVINANAITTGNGGNVVLWADNVTKFYGNIFSQGGLNSGNGGLVETSGKAYLDANGGSVDTLAANGETGMWLLDPTNIFIAVNQAAATTAGMVGVDATANTVNAGVFQASGVVQDSLLTTANLVTALGTSNVNVTTTNASGTGLGNITVVSPITWAGANALTLTAANNIIINAAISGVNGSLNLNAANTAQSITTGAGGTIAVRNFNLVQGQWYQVGVLPSFSATNNFQINSGVMPNAVTQFIRATSGDGTNTPFVIADLYGLQGIGSTATTLAYNYALANNIDASSTSTWNSAAGFVPIGTNASPFRGNTVLSTDAITFEGNNFSISNLFINRPATSYVGLFGALYINADPANSYTIQNVALPNATVTGNAWVGALVGGLIGTTKNMSLVNTSMTGTVTGMFVGDAFVGGLFGEFNGNVSNSYAISTVNATSGNKVGGLGGSIRENGNTTVVSGNYSLSTVNGLADVGGLIGEIQGANGSISLSNVYSGGSVTGTTNVGGLIGRMTNNLVLNFNSLTNAYSFAKVAGTTNVGGLIGQLNSNNLSATNTVMNSFATGFVTGTNAVGGLVGLADAYIVSNNNYWNTETTGQAVSATGTGQTTTQMMAQATYAGWDFASTWSIIEGQSYPYLSAFYSTAPRVISGTTGATGGQTVQLAVNATLFDTTYTGANGFYYFLEGLNTRSNINQSIADDSSLLTYLTTGAVNGNGVALAPLAGASLTGLNYAADTIGVGGDIASSITNTILGTAKGALINTRILYSNSGANLTLGNATNLTANLVTSANTTYSVDGSISMVTNGIGALTFNNRANLNSASIISNGIQTYNGIVILFNTVSLASGNNNIVFNDTIDRATSPRSLTINAGTGAITLGGNIGAGVNGALGALTLNSTGVTTIGGTIDAASVSTNAGGSTLLNGGTITTTSTQTYGDAVTIGADTTITTTNAAVAFQSTLNRDAGAARSLTVNSGSGAQTYTGIVGGGVNGALGDMTFNSTGVTTLTGNIAANSLTTNTGGTLSIGAGTINTTGNIAFGEATTFTTTSKTFTSSAGSISFGSTLAGGAQGLTLNSATGTTVSGAITGLANLTANGPLNLNANITTTGVQTYNGAITLGNGVTLTSTNSAITLNSTLDRDATVRNVAISSGSGAITLAGNIGSGINGALGTIALNSTGATTIGGSVNATSLATNAGGTTNITGGSISTSTTQSYADAVTISADTTLSSGGAITFTSTLNSDATPRNLVVNSSGSTTFSGIVGGINPLNSITTNATGTTTFANNATTVGDMIFNDNVVSSGVAKILTSNAGAITFNGTLTGTLGISLLSSTGITFNQNVALTSTAALTVTGPAAINAATISTGGNQTWNDTFTFSQALTTLTATGAAANINIVQPLNWANSNTLYLAATGASGTLTLPSSITSTNGGLIQLNASAVANMAANDTVINVSRFNLIRGIWSQVGLVNPAFYAEDFQLNSSGTPPSTTSFYRALSGDGTIATPYQIYDVYGLQGIGSGTGALARQYILANDIDMTPTNAWNSGTGFNPIGTSAAASRFTGSIDGNNFTLDNMIMNKTSSYTALVAYMSGGTVRNLNLTNLNITSTAGLSAAIVGQMIGGSLIENINISGSVVAASVTGGAVGRSLSSNPFSINNVHMTGTVTGSNVVGGLVGSIQNNNGTNGIANSSANAIVTGGTDVGGLLGEMQNNNADMYITNSFATGSVTGVTSVGGLVGRMQGNNSVNPFINEIINSYSTSTVNGTTNVGGLVGQMRTTNINLLGYNTITNSFSAGQVNIVGTGASIGGLVGYMNILSIVNGSYSNVASIADTAGSTDIGGLVGSNEGEINNSYAITSLSGQATTNNIGGLVGNNAGTITNTYSIGSVNGNGATTVGGLIGVNTGTVNNSYWDTDTSGLVTSAGGSGLTTLQMQNQANYNGWDFATTWNIVDGQTYPFLRAFYSVVPRAISGTTNATSGTAITFAANGTVLDTTYTGANGTYYFLAGNNLISGINSTIVDGDAVLAYLNSNGLVGNAVTLAPTSGGSISGLNLSLNGLNIGSDIIATLNVSVLSDALGGLSGGNFLYSVTGNNLTLGNNITNNIDFTTSSQTTYNLTGDINSINGATSSSITFYGLTNAGFASNLSAAVVNFMNGITGSSNIDVTGISGNNLLTVKTSTAPIFNVTGLNTGNVTGIGTYSGLLSFSNMQNIIGGDNGNTFIISNNAGLSGVINGANTAGTSTLDLTNINTGVNITLTMTNDGSVQTTTNNFITSFANINNIKANQSNTNTLVVPSNQINNVYITDAGIGYINNPMNFSGVRALIGTSASAVNFLTTTTYNPVSGLYTVNGIPMTFTNFGTVSGYTIVGRNNTIQAPSIVANVIQQPATNADQNNNAPLSDNSKSLPVWKLLSIIIAENLSQITIDIKNSFSVRKKVSLNYIKSIRTSLQHN